MKKLLGLILLLVIGTSAYAESIPVFTLAPYVGVRKFNFDRDLKSSAEVGALVHYRLHKNHYVGGGLGLAQTFNGDSIQRVKTYEISSIHILPFKLENPYADFYVSPAFVSDSLDESWKVTVALGVRFMPLKTDDTRLKGDFQAGYDYLARVALDRDVYFKGTTPSKTAPEVKPEPLPEPEPLPVVVEEEPKEPTPEPKPVVAKPIRTGIKAAPLVAQPFRYDPETDTSVKSDRWIYKVIAGAYRLQADANLLSDHLVRDGFATYLWKERGPDGRTYYLVQAYATRTLTEASYYKSLLIDQGYENTYILRSTKQR